MKPVDNLLVAKRSHDLGKLYNSQSRYALASPVYERAIELTDKSARATYEEKATYREKLADAYSEQGNSDKAGQLLKGAIAIRESQHDTDTPPLALRIVSTLKR